MRGGIFDRIQLIQGEISDRFRDKQHRRIGRVAAEGAPDFPETDLFIVPAEAGFDPAEPFRLQLLVQRAVGPIEKVFLTFDLGYELPDAYTRTVGAAAPDARRGAGRRRIASRGPRRAVAADLGGQASAGRGARPRPSRCSPGIFFFQTFATRNARAFAILRIAFLVFTLVFVGWYANAQLSVVNVLAFASALFSRLPLGDLPDGPADLHPVVRGRRGAAVLGPRRLLRLALPVRRAAGAVEQDRPPPRRAAGQRCPGGCTSGSGR